MFTIIDCLDFQIENQLANDDVGRDLTSVQNMLKKQQLLENDIANHEVIDHIRG